MTQRSKKHHEVPKWLLKNFCIGRSDHLWVGFCRNRKVVKLHRANVFYRKNGNTRTDYIPDGGGGFRPVRSDRDERILARFDSRASMVTKQLLQWARKHHQTGEAPFHLRQAVVNQCKALVVTQARRTHPSQDRVGLTTGFEDLWWDLAYRRAEYVGFALGPREELTSEPRMQALVSDAEQNERANFASGDHPILKDKENSFLLDAGLGVGVIPCSGPRLVLGNQGITILEEPGGVVSYLPLAPDVVVYLTAEPNSVAFVSLRDTFAEHHNKGACTMSRSIAGNSKQAIEDLLETLDH